MMKRLLGDENLYVLIRQYVCLGHYFPCQGLKKRRLSKAAVSIIRHENFMLHDGFFLLPSSGNS